MCINIYFVVLLHLAVVGGTLDNKGWMTQHDQRVVKVNDLLKGKYNSVIGKILQRKEVCAFVVAPAEAVGMINIEPVGNGKVGQTTAVAIKATRKYNQEDAITGFGAEICYFPVVLEYLNLGEGVSESEQLRIASKEHQDYTVDTLENVKAKVRARFESTGVTMKSSTIHAIKKKVSHIVDKISRLSHTGTVPSGGNGGIEVV